MIFADKGFLLLLLLIPLAALFLAFSLKKRKKDLGFLISKNNLAILSNVNFKAYVIKNVFLLAGFVFLIAATAEPKYGDEKIEVEKMSSEIIAVLDVSKSMLAEDIKPSRIEKAKMLISRIVEECEGDKIGVMVFSAGAMWQCPMTYDVEAIKMFLQGVNTDSLPFGGTEFSSPINLVVKTLGENSSNSRVMILITDGEDHDKKTKEAVELAKKSELRIISVGIGTYQGAPIPVKTDSGTLVKYMSDKRGKTVISKLNSELLKKISLETGGNYYEISDGRDIAPAVINEIKGLDKNIQGKIKENAKRSRFQIFLFLALAAFVIEMFYPKTVKNRK
ncbi:MAG: VWA domain-containing protein [Endomicrobium sp.]|jgi:Ca-activated chloride channel family protein|nr:VWA domain-containing protein [Endomicrobium sp.]